ncbi:hypothetical protein HQ571_02970 [Candidatus Kuenenbacteria bacterium]|nr:hypothetical protein [Candidatus Kuenenbacteria bacterium]
MKDPTMGNDPSPEVENEHEKEVAEESYDDLGLCLDEDEFNKVEFSVKNIDQIADWADKELEAFEEMRSSFGMGFHLEDELESIFSLVARKMNVKVDASSLLNRSVTKSSEDYDDHEEGEVSFFGETIGYSTGHDGWGFRLTSTGEIKKAMKRAFTKMLAMKE